MRTRAKRSRVATAKRRRNVFIRRKKIREKKESELFNSIEIEDLKAKVMMK